MIFVTAAAVLLNCCYYCSLHASCTISVVFVHKLNLRSLHESWRCRHTTVLGLSRVVLYGSLASRVRCCGRSHYRCDKIASDPSACRTAKKRSRPSSVRKWVANFLFPTHFRTGQRTELNVGINTFSGFHSEMIKNNNLSSHACYYCFRCCTNCSIAADKLAVLACPSKKWSST